MHSTLLKIREMQINRAETEVTKVTAWAKADPGNAN